MAKVHLTETEFYRYRSALDPLQLLEDRPSFRMVDRNYRQLAALHRYYQTFFAQVKDKGRIDAGEAGFSLTVETMNWLTAVRLFLDHQETEYKRRHGRSSAQLDRFKATTRAAFDRSFGYRFTYKLRNYAQHCGLPLSGVRVRAPRESESGAAPIEFYLDRDDLLFAYNEWGPVKKGLQAMPETFALLPLVNEAMDELQGIARELLRIDVEFALAGVPTIREAVDRLGCSTGRALMAFRPNRDGTTDFSFAPLPTDSALAHLETLIADGGDPLSLVEAPSESAPPPVSPDHVYRDRRGIAVMAAWLQEGGGTPKFFDTVNDLMDEDDNIEPVMTGLLNLTAVSLTMAAAAVGTTPVTILGNMVAQPAAEGEAGKTRA